MAWSLGIREAGQAMPLSGGRIPEDVTTVFAAAVPCPNAVVMEVSVPG